MRLFLQRQFFKMQGSTNLSKMHATFRGETDKFLESQIDKKEPISLFDSWFKQACDKDILEPGAISLATVDSKSRPSVRYVILKEYGPEGFTFCTRYDSRKAEDIENNSWVAFAVYWKSLHRSVRVEGRARKVSAAESDAFFAARGKSAQVGVFASPQSKPIPSREYLDDIEAKLKEEYRDKDVPRPNWGGYVIEPDTVEFWQGQQNRLHDRIRFQRRREDLSEFAHEGDDGWFYERLAP